jgi:hypothetical protein
LPSQPPYSATRVPQPHFILVHFGPSPDLVPAPSLSQYRPPGLPYPQVPAGLTCHPAALRPKSGCSLAPPTSRPGPPRGPRRRSRISGRAGPDICCPLAVSWLFHFAPTPVLQSTGKLLLFSLGWMARWRTAISTSQRLEIKHFLSGQ